MSGPGRKKWVYLLAAALALGACAACAAAVWWWRRTEAILVQADAALARREYAKARGLFDDYLERRPGNVAARLRAARACRRMKDYEAALDHLRRCREEGGDAEGIDVEYSLIDLQRGEYGAVPSLRERVQQEDDLALTVLEALVQYDLETYQLRQAQHDLDEFLRRRPTDLQARLGRGYVWERFLSFADAVEDYRQAVAAHPESELARLRLADALVLAGTPREALEHYEWLAERWPSRPEVRLGLARCRRRLGDAEAARKLLEALVAETPEQGVAAVGEALLERGQLALDAGQPGEGEPWLRRAYAALPYDRRTSYGLEQCLRALGRADEADRYRQRVAEVDATLRRLDQIRREVMQRPHDAALRSEGGMLFLRTGERNEAIRWLQLALRLDPQCEPARQALAEARRPDVERK